MDVDEDSDQNLDLWPCWMFLGGICIWAISIEISGASQYIKHSRIRTREYQVHVFWYQVYQARLWERFLTLRGLPGDSTSVLKAEPGKLDIKRREPGNLFISLFIFSLFKLAIMTSFSIFALIQRHLWHLKSATSSWPDKGTCREIDNLYPGFPHNRENGKSPGIRYWSFTAIKSPGISTFGDLSRELSGKICSLAHPQRHSYAWMLNLVYQLFFREKTTHL